MEKMEEAGFTHPAGELGWALSRYFGAFLGMIVFPRIDAADVATAADASGGA